MIGEDEIEKGSRICIKIGRFLDLRNDRYERVNIV